MSLFNGLAYLLRSYFANTDRIRDALRYSTYVLERTNSRLAAILIRRAATLTEEFVSEANQRALTYFDQGDYALAEAEFRAVVYEDPTDYQGLRGLAVSLEHQQEYEEAIYYYSTALSHYPSDWEMRSYRILCLFDDGRGMEALAEYDQFIDDADESAQRAAVHLATSTVDSQPKRALALLKKVDAASSNEASTLGFLAHALSRNDERDESETHATRALQLDPYDQVANQVMAVLKATEDTESALSYAQRAVEVAETSNLADLPFALNTVGWVRYLTGDYRGAEESLNQALELAPDLVFVRFNLGLTLLAASDAELAHAEFEKAIRQTESMAADLAATELGFAIDDLDELEKEHEFVAELAEVRDSLLAAQMTRSAELTDLH